MKHAPSIDDEGYDLSETQIEKRLQAIIIDEIEGAAMLYDETQRLLQMYSFLNIGNEYKISCGT